MWGQWLGKIGDSDSSTNKGQIIISMDRDRPYHGKIQVIETRDGTPMSHNWNITFVRDETNPKFMHGTLADIVPYDNNFNFASSAPAGVILGSTGSLTGTFNDHEDELNGEWQTDIGTHGDFSIRKFESDTFYEADQTFTSWSEFTSWFSKFNVTKSELIFRGNDNNQDFLRTSFHKANRRDIFRYTTVDVPTLARRLSGVIDRIVDLSNPVEYGAFLNLVQHHGYPTPLLDWTESPFVAAFFAFNRLDKWEEENDDFIRIYAFNNNLYKEHYPRIESMDDPRPTFSVIPLSMLGNKRAVAQQSINAYCNMYDIEGLIEYHSEEQREKYLTRIDIAKSERNTAMSELSFMNITSESLFPGLDGSCQSLKEKYF